MHFRVQRLDPAVHHLREAGELGHVDDLEAGLFQRLGGAAGGDEFDAEAGKRGGEVHQSGFVGHRQQGAGDAARVAGHGKGLAQEQAKCIGRLGIMARPAKGGGQGGGHRAISTG